MIGVAFDPKAQVDLRGGDLGRAAFFPLSILNDLFRRGRPGIQLTLPDENGNPRVLTGCEAARHRFMLRTDSIRMAYNIMYEFGKMDFSSGIAILSKDAMEKIIPSNMHQLLFAALQSLQINLASVTLNPAQRSRARALRQHRRQHTFAAQAARQAIHNPRYHHQAPGLIEAQGRAAVNLINAFTDPTRNPRAARATAGMALQQMVATAIEAQRSGNHAIATAANAQLVAIANAMNDLGNKIQAPPIRGTTLVTNLRNIPAIVTGLDGARRRAHDVLTGTAANILSIPGLVTPAPGATPPPTPAPTPAPPVGFPPMPAPVGTPPGFTPPTPTPHP